MYLKQIKMTAFLLFATLGLAACQPSNDSDVDQGVSEIMSATQSQAASGQNINASEAEEALTRMCEKLQQCALASMQSEDLPQAMLDMLAKQTQMQCQHFMTIDEDHSNDEALAEKAKLCLNDMAQLPCDRLMIGEEPSSCQAYKGYQG
ncbi:hypothetical protein PN836_009385 [Ningiella sp. W23]|uniref:hypothetical protein n=1 Tax=Ningiella sp. W23 TaxID=3023715 RepID=UPI0037573C8C